jgi:hypothetical protein
VLIRIEKVLGLKLYVRLEELYQRIRPKVPPRDLQRISILYRKPSHTMKHIRNYSITLSLQ